MFTKANDHDFDVIGQTTPVGILIPKNGDLALYMVSSSVTSDCIVDLLQQWWDDKKQSLVINLDNGPEQQSHRTQFMKRIQDFSNQNHIRIQLAYYPPYHSKYNPIERTLDAVYGYAKSMTWKGIHPIVKIIEKTYEKAHESPHFLKTQKKAFPIRLTLQKFVKSIQYFSSLVLCKFLKELIIKYALTE